MISRRLYTVLGISCALALAGSSWRVSAQTPIPAASGVPGAPGRPAASGAPVAGPSSAADAPRPGAPPSGVPAQPPPGQPSGQGEWNLSDLVDGLLKLESAQLPLTHDQVTKIKPALEKVLEATRIMTETETQLKQTLTPEQLAFIEARRKSGELRPDAGLGAPKKPGEDPVVAKVLEILEARAR